MNNKVLSISGNFVGNTYLATVVLENTSNTSDYAFNHNEVILKYKTAMIGTTYFTIEDAIAEGSGSITFAGNATGTATYVETRFTELHIIDKSPYATGDNKVSYDLSGRKLIVPFAEGVTDYSATNNNYNNNVYAVIIVPESITLNVNNNASIVVTAFLRHSSTVNVTETRQRGVLLNNGTINIGTGKSGDESSMYAYGYIKGNGIINIKNYSFGIESMRIYDWPGGTAAVGMKNNVFPTNSWSMHNNSCKTRIYSGASYSGFVYATMSNPLGGNPIEIKSNAMIVGDNSEKNSLFVSINDGSEDYVEKSSPDTDNEITTSNQTKKQRDKIYVSGDYKDGNFKMTVWGQSIGTSTSLPCPLGYTYIIIGEGSSLSLTQSDYLLFPGTKTEVEEGSTLTIGSNVDFTMMKYSSLNNTGTRKFEPYSETDAELIVNGKLIVNGNIGGFITTTVDNATLEINGNATGSYKVLMNTSSPYYYEGTEKSFGFIYNQVENEINNLTLGTYYSKNNGWYKVGNIVINYHSNYPANTYDDYNVSSSTLISSDENGAKIPSNIDTAIVPNKPDYYEFGGWYFDAACSDDKKASGMAAYNDTTLYAKWNPIEYTVNVVIQHKTGVDSSKTSHDVQKTYKVTEGNITLDIPINENNTFIGWFAKFDNGAYSIDVDSLDDLLPYANGTTINVYGYFEGEPTITINYNYSSILSNPSNAFVSENGVIKQEDWAIIYNNVMYYNEELIESNTELQKYFLEWRDQNNNVFDENTVLTSSVTITAIWVEKAKITYYDSNNNEHKSFFIPKEGDYSSFTIENSGVSKADDDQNTYFIRYTFDSWDIPNTLNENQDGTYTPISDSHIYPTFTSKEYIYVKLDISGATVSVNDTNYTSSRNIEFERGNNSITIKLVGYSNNNNRSFTINGSSVNEKTFENEMSHISVVASSSCLVEGTLITMADGTKKKVEDVVPGDMLLIFNHETGKYDVAPVLFNDSEELSNYTVINLVFSDGTIIKVVSEHGFFDLDLMKYVYIDEINHRDFIGHQFYYSDIINSSIVDGKVTLVDSYITTEYTRVYSPVTKYHLNYFTNNLLSMPGGIDGLFNIFEYDETLKYDEEKKQNDIETYGLYTYEDFKDLVSYEIYESFPANYFAVAIGKGLLTWEEINYYIERYTPLM